MSKNGEDRSRGPAVLAVTSALLVCSTIFVFLRLVSRFAIVKKVGLDDYFMALAWILAFGLSFTICYGTAYGLGRHERDVPEDWQSTLKETQYAFSVIYNPALMATKTSILVFYLTLSETRKIFRWATIATLAVVNVAGLALTLLNAFQCRPVDGVFETPTPTWATCTDIVTLYQSSAPVNIITDLAIFFLPMPILTSMRLPRKQKIILIITFSFGVFVAVVDVVRIAYLQRAAYWRLRALEANSDEPAWRLTEEDDFSWYSSLSFMWSAVEVNVGIMCACVPGLKPLVARFLPRFIRNPGEESVADSGVPNMRTYGTSVAERLPSDNQPGGRRPEPHADIGGFQRSGNGSDGHESDGAIGFVEFLTTPDTISFPGQFSPTDNGTESLPQLARRGTQTFVDFVQMGQKKSMVRMTNRESYFSVAMVTVLFFVWGFAYGLLDVLNIQFQMIAHMTTTQTISTHSAYFAAYFVASMSFGRLVLKRWGFKACYIVGLSIYACGTLVFWSAAVLTSFPAFLISNFIVGLGLSTLEIAANPFIALCGPPDYAEIRLNLSQAVQAIGGVVSPLLAKKVLFNNVLHAPSLVDTQWTYLGIAFFTILLAVGYYYVPLPEATDDELEELCARDDCANTARINLPSIVGSGNPEKGITVLSICLAMSVFSQFCYVGGQEAVNTSFASYLAATSKDLDPVSYQAIGHTLFAASRFLGAAANMLIKPRTLLLMCFIGAAAFSAAAMGSYSSTDIPAALTLMIYFSEGPLFSLIYAIGLRGQGRGTKDAAAMITAATSGGAVFPPIMHVIENRRGIRTSYAVVVATFVGGAVMPVWLLASHRAKRIVDPARLPALDYWRGRKRSGEAPEHARANGAPWRRNRRPVSLEDSEKSRASAGQPEHSESAG